MYKRQPNSNDNQPYKNRYTFLYQTDINCISNPLELDDYLFDVEELIAYAKNDVNKLYVNPHIMVGNNEFSEIAKIRLQNHQQLKSFAKFLNSKLQTVYECSETTLEALITMLKDFNRHGTENSAKSRAIFMEHKYTLTENEQNQLDQSIIKVSNCFGGTQNVEFKHAFLGGHMQCIDTAQIFLWQFVIDRNPLKFHEIPQEIHAKASRMHMLIKNDFTPEYEYLPNIYYSQLSYGESQAITTITNATTRVVSIHDLPIRREPVESGLRIRLYILMILSVYIATLIDKLHTIGGDEANIEQEVQSSFAP